MSKVLMVASEATPYAKTGGLADVVGALPKALRELGHQVAVLVPLYAQTRAAAAKRIWDHVSIRLGGASFDCSFFTDDSAPPAYFIDCPPLFDRPGIYGDAAGDFPDNHVRFALLSRSALELSRYIFRPDILHCHDWQTGLVPTYLKTTFSSDPTFFGIRTLFTIHNLGYQGIFSPPELLQTGLGPELYRPDSLGFRRDISLLKGGLVYSDALNTVSPTYAREIQMPEYGFGMDALLRERGHVLTGILNGVDYDRWNPETDPYLPSTYSAEHLEGKRICKRELLKEFGLSENAIDRPLLGIVSRFTSQKGVDLIIDTAEGLFGEDVYLVALGNGELAIEAQFRSLAEANPGRVGIRFGFDDALAHRIEAGADMFLMPSRYEPCGLNQIYSLRYGAVPVVRATGGLDDTIEIGTGFKFQEYSGWALLRAIRAACATYRNRDEWIAMTRRGMAKDFSWHASARQYSQLYDKLLNP